MENFRNIPKTNQEIEAELVAKAWSLVVTIVPTPTAISLADTFINNHTENLDKAEIEAQVEDFTMDLNKETLPPETRLEILKSMSNTRNFLSNS